MAIVHDPEAAVAEAGRLEGEFRSPLCPCPSSKHGRVGCGEEAVEHSEDPGEWVPCSDCAPFDALRLHLSDWPAAGFARRGYSAADLAEANADLALVMDETGGRGFVA